MRRIIYSLIIILCAYLGFVIYADRALLFSRFDEQYWKDKYEHSQWKLPLSIRTIGDDGLYLYEGYRLIHGADPTDSNAEMPPLGKYLIGASISLFGNGHIYGLLTTLLLLAGTFTLSVVLFGQTVPALGVTLLLATDPLITNQFTLTMMDSLQAALLVWYLVLVFITSVASLRRRVFVSFATGLVLGLFSQTKLPVLTPILGSIGAWYLWKKFRDTRTVIALALGGLVGYMLPYTVYFLRGHTLLDWLKIQKWIVSFYRHSNLTPTWGSAIVSLLIGKYQNIFSRVWETAGQWSPIWGFAFVASFAAAISWIRLKKRDIRWGIVFGVLAATIGIYAVIPFWTRYLVAVLPLLYLSGVWLLNRLPPRTALVVFVVLLTVNIASSLPVLTPPPQATVNQVIYTIEHAFFADLYEDSTADVRRSVDRDTFRRFGLKALSDGEIEFIDIEQLSPPLTSRQSPQYVSMSFTYYTRRLGTFTETVAIPFVRENNRWRIPWQWQFLLPGLSESSHLVTSVAPARRGTLFGSDGKPLAADSAGSMVWVTPGRIDKTREDALLRALETAFDGRLPKVALHQRIVGNTLPDHAVPIGVIPYPKTDPNVLVLSGFSGVTLTDAFARVTYPNNVDEIGTLQNSTYAECCSYLYSTTNFDGISGLEQEYNGALKGINGGAMMLKNLQGDIQRTYVSGLKKDGADVRL